MRPHVRRVPALRHDPGIGPDGTVGVDLLRAVRLVVVLALPAVKTRPRLGSDANALALLDQGHLGSDADRLADDLVADGEGELLLAPAARDGVHVARAHAAALDLDFDVVVPERLGVELVLLEGRPGRGGLDLEAFVLVVF